jgi:alkaline phosphatase D
MDLDRRSFVGGLATATVAAPAILRAQQVFGFYPFALGVAAGDPAPDGFVIWTRLAPQPLEPHGGMPMAPVALDWQVANDFAFKQIVARGNAVARPELGHAVHVEVAGLQPGRTFFYRFLVGTERSPHGRARTLPPYGARLDKLRLGVVGCQNYEHGFYTAYRHIAEEDELDAIFHYGDYIYEGAASPMTFTQDRAVRPFVREHVGGECYSLDDYRRRYAQYKMDLDLQAAHHACAWWTVFDDHEVQDNYAGLIDKHLTPPDAFAYRRAAAYQAWYEHTPVRASAIPRGPDIQLYRRARYGDLVDLHLLDTRQFRTDQPCNDEIKPYCPGIDDPKAQMMGTPEEAWLARGLRSGARWNAVAQQVMMMPVNRQTELGGEPLYNVDSWAGYNAPRERVLKMFEGLGNVVVLTGDEHQNWVGELRRDNGHGAAVAVEFVATSISSDGDGGDTRPGMDRIMAANPFLKFYNYQRGYDICEITPDAWETKLRVVDKVSERGLPIRTRATITVPHGRPELHVA